MQMNDLDVEAIVVVQLLGAAIYLKVAFAQITLLNGRVYDSQTRRRFRK